MKLIKGGKKEPAVEKDHSNHWRVVVPNPDHPPLKPGEEEITVVVVEKN